ncbi:MAG: hypothetical protein KDC46_09705 [Thermoleophilia bacterium]|nr:hypothetical protein [Thermoleophilia bacterium]
MTLTDIGVSCQEAGGCITQTNGFGISLNAALYYAIVRVTDSVAPTFANAAGDPLTDTTNWRRGTLNVTFDASDNTGIRYTEMRVDGVTQGGPTWAACYSGGAKNTTSYTYRIPCGSGSASARTALNVTNRSYNYDTSALNGAHTVQLRAGDSTDISTPNTGTQSFSVNWDNTAPTTPASAADSSGADIEWSTSGSALAANWAASTDAHSGIYDYEYCFSTATSCGGTVVSNGNIAATTRTSGGLTLVQGTRYYSCVRARDNALDNSGARGNLSGWRCSDGQRVDSVAPTTPGAPADGAGADIDWQASTTTVNAHWTASTDATSGLDHYEYCISTAASCGGTVVVGWTANGTSTSVTRAGLSLTTGTTYFVAVRAHDLAGNASSVASTDGVTVDTTAPNVPPLVSPPDNSGHAAWPSLVATYDDAGTVSPGQLTFQVCPTAACTSPAASGTSASALADGSNGSWTPAVANGTWWWRAMATDGAGNTSGWSGTRMVQVGSSSLSLSVDTTTLNGGFTVPGTPVTASSTVTVSTNAINGYQLLGSDMSDTVGITDGTHDVPDWTGTVGTPTVWPAGTLDAFGVTVRDAPGGRLAKWGTGGGPWPEGDFVNNRYAGLTTTPQLLHLRAGHSTSNEDVILTWRFTPALAAVDGSYASTVNVSVVVNP